jgi:hypothetical protein
MPVPLPGKTAAAPVKSFAANALAPGPADERTNLRFHIANRIPGCLTLTFRSGVIAQLVERLNGIEEVWGSNPHGSTFFYRVKTGCAVTR